MGGPLSWKTLKDMSKRSERDIVEIFAALSDSTRLSLISKLSARSQSATSLAEGGTVTRQAVSKHLQVLESAGLVVHEKQGREVLYSLELQRLEHAKAFLENASANWDRAIARLRNMVED
jgi:DNA-binding transcriptional ArsR family regulator